MYRVNLDFPAFVISFLCLLFSLLVRRRQYIPPTGIKNKLSSQHFIFIAVLVSHILASLGSFLSVYFQEHPVDISYHLVFWLNEVYFFFHVFLAMFFALYIINVYSSILGRKKMFYLLFFFPFIVSEILVIINPFINVIFKITDTLEYIRGPLIIVLYLCGAFYLIFSLYFFIRYKKAITKEDSIAVGFVIIMACAGLIAQGLLSDWLLECFAESLAFAAALILLEERGGHIDQTTGVLNKRAFIDTNRRFLENNKNYSIIMIRIVNIDTLTKTLSTTDMNHLIVEISDFLSTIAATQNIYSYRYGAFALFGANKTDEDNDNKTKQIIDRFKEPFDVFSNKIIVHAAICVTKFPEDISTLSDLEDLININYLEDRDESFIVSKKEFEVIKVKLFSERALRNALDNKKIDIYYQPIYSTSKNKVIAAEALLRVNDDLLKKYSPELYIPIAEKTGLIHEIGLYVFEDVCKFYKENNLEEKGIEYIELNLSLYQLLSKDLVNKFEEIRKKYDISASNINLEITESGAMPLDDNLIESIKELQDLGYNFSLDDFGTGYSNLVKLFKISFKNIKIDKSILWDASTNEASYKFLESMFEIIKGIGSNTIQEGVENETQLDLIKKFGGDLVQGFYYSKPIRKDEFIEFIKK